MDHGRFGDRIAHAGIANSFSCAYLNSWGSDQPSFSGGFNAAAYIEDVIADDNAGFATEPLVLRSFVGRDVLPAEDALCHDGGCRKE